MCERLGSSTQLNAKCPIERSRRGHDKAVKIRHVTYNAEGICINACEVLPFVIWILSFHLFLMQITEVPISSDLMILVYLL